MLIPSLPNTVAVLIEFIKFSRFVTKRDKRGHLFQLEDPMGEATAKMNVADLRKVLGLDEEEISVKSPSLTVINDQLDVTNSALSYKSNSNSIPERTTEYQRFHRVRRESMEQLNLIKVVPLHFIYLLIY